MERYKKKDMLKTVDMLFRANDAIVKIITSNPQGAGEALVQCQESAIAMGTYIDTLGDKYAQLVHMLEDYCENIYQMSESMSDENRCRKVAKKIQKQLTGLQNGIKYDLPEDKKEVVFLPYKASMWDSLESVWKAVDADPDCDAYVIPIPYFDKNPDGSFKEEHYEEDLYPKDVPITRYDEYDLETQHPDVIYIHNPYDECNHVTSVHPYFYSKNLRNYTDKLVYIPYFILGEIEPDDQAAIDGMKHFCFTPGTIYADQVIVQSENMRQIYINEYMKAAKEMGLDGEHVDRKFLEKKFLGTGSPKLEKVQNTKKEDLEIPKEWLRIIEKPDGSFKKIVFYNTSVSALLHHDEKMLRKMESVFEIFKENRDEVALLWRPHPLIQATIESMRPQLWEAYQKIRDRYIEEGWGIYDESAELDRAVVISDAYYGDPSSVVQLCREKGMPVMVQDADIDIQKDNMHYLLNSLVMDENAVYFVPHNLNVLVKYLKEENKTEWALLIPKTNTGQSALYADIKRYKNKLFLIPMHDTKIVVYDLNKNFFEQIPIPDSKHRKSNWGNFSKAYKEKHFLYLVGYRYPGVVRLDMETNQCEQVLDIYQMFPADITERRIELDSVEKDCCIYFLLSNCNILVKYDMTQEKVSSYHLENRSEKCYQMISYDSRNFWISGDGIEYLRWDEKTQSKFFYKHPKHNDILEDDVYRYSFYQDGKIYVLPFKEAPIVVLDCRDFNKSNLMWKEDKNKKGFSVNYLFAKEQRGVCIDLESQTNIFLDLKTDKFMYLAWEKDKEKIVHALLTDQSKKEIKEGGISLKDFVDMILNVRWKNNADKCNLLVGSDGKKIS